MSKKQTGVLILAVVVACLAGSQAIAAMVRDEGAVMLLSFVWGTLCGCAGMLFWGSRA